MSRMNGTWIGGVVAVAALSALVGGTSCDPVHSDAVNALGPEPDGQRKGPLHRAGQPCTVCHGGEGPGKTEFVVAGTVYETDQGDTPAVGVVVRLTDFNGAVFDLDPSNEVGTFYATTSDYAPVFPISVTFVKGNGESAQPMTSHIGRAGSCADCHLGNSATIKSVPHVYMKAGK